MSEKPTIKELVFVINEINKCWDGIAKSSLTCGGLPRWAQLARTAKERIDGKL